MIHTSYVAQFDSTWIWINFRRLLIDLRFWFDFNYDFQFWFQINAYIMTSDFDDSFSLWLIILMTPDFDNEAIFWLWLQILMIWDFDDLRFLWLNNLMTWYFGWCFDDLRFLWLEILIMIRERRSQIFRKSR